MKKLIRTALLFTVCCAMLLCGCSVNKDNQATGEDGKAMEEEKRNPGVDEKFPSYVPVGSEYNVKDFGAAGDGVTDDSAAVLEAVAKVKEKVGGTVYFPDGQYRITEKVTFGAECILAFDDGACLLAEAPVRVNGYVKSDSHILFRGEGEYSYSLKNPYVTPVWFGAEGDGRTDDTEAFTAAIAMSEEIYIPATDAGYVVGELKLAKPIRIVGIPSESGEKPALVGKEGIDSLFKFIANNIYINCLRIEMGNTGEAPVFFFDTSTAGKTDHKLFDIDVYGAYCVVTDAGVVQNLIINSLIDDVNCYDCRGTALVLRCFWGFIFFRNLTIDSSGTLEKYGVTVDFPAVRLENNAGCVFQNMEIIGDGNENAGQNGFLYSNNIATWMDGCSFKNLGGSAIKCTGASSFLYFSNLTAEGCRGNSFDFSGITYPKIHGLSVDGSVGRNGIVVNNCNYAQITSCKVTGAVKNGIHVISSRGITVTGCEITRSGEYGIYGSGNGSVNCVDCVFEGNIKGDYTSDVVNSSEKQ